MLLALIRVHKQERCMPKGLGMMWKETTL